MTAILRKSLNFIFPPRCPICDEILDWEEGLIHERCDKKLVYTGENTCMRCGRPVVSEQVEYCFDCTRKKREYVKEGYTQGKSLFVYQGPVKKTMYRFKYSNKREYGAFFSQVTMERFGSWIRQCGIEAIVAVPMYGRKKRRRGYNQAEVFGKCLSEQMGLPYWSRCLLRVRDTRPMKELNDRERKNNLKKAFQMKKNIVKYTKVLLVDDIYTTGCTADEISKVLMKSGVAKVYVLSICIGQGV